MSDIKCPYCGKEQEINHDDGYGYCEDEEYEQCCTSCDKDFKFDAIFSLSYDVFCNKKEDHVMATFVEGLSGCKNCDFWEEDKVELK